MANRMILNETSYFGKGAIENVPTEFKARGFKAVITDKDLVKFEVATKVTKLLMKQVSIMRYMMGSCRTQRSKMSKTA